MYRFQYTARNVTGDFKSGSLAGTSDQDIAQLLKGQGLTAITIVSHRKNMTVLLENMKARFFRFPLDDILYFSRQMYTVCHSGLPILDGIQNTLNSYVNLSKSKNNFASVLADVKCSIESGCSLSQALGPYHGVFPGFFIGLIRVGEETGNLSHAFFQIEQYLMLEMRQKKQLRAAIRYPVFVFFSLLVALVVVNLYVFPVFAELFSSFDADLPFLTQFLIDCSLYLKSFGIVTGVILFVVFFLSATLLKASDRAQYFWGKMCLCVPILGSFYRKYCLARYARSMGILINNQLPAQNAIVMAIGTVGNRFLEKKLMRVHTYLLQGGTFTEAHRKTALFSPMMVDTVKMGEHSGNLSQGFQQVAELIERDIDHFLTGLGAKLEPILIVVMALFVGVLAMGIFVPLWDLYEVQGGYFG